MKDLTQKAFDFANKAHEGQLDDSGKPYFLTHCTQVAGLVTLTCPEDYNLICAAYLHDVVEDCGFTYEELIKEFDQDIADLVMEVTHEGTNDNVGYYFPRLNTQRGIVLKFADRMSNLSRMECWNDKRQDQYLRKSKFWKSNPTQS